METLRRGRELVEVARHDGWILVDVPIAELRGWVFGQLLRTARTRTESRETTDSSGEHHRVDGTGVRLRAGPGTQFETTAQLCCETELVEVGRRADWVHVESVATGLSGWVFEGLLTSDKDSTTISANPEESVGDRPGVPQRWVVLRHVVQVKRAPESSSSTLYEVLRGKEVLAVSRKGDWLRVRQPDDAMDGWLHVDGVERADIVAAGTAEFLRQLKTSARAVHGRRR